MRKLLSILISKLLACWLGNQVIDCCVFWHLAASTQIVGMSATLGNMDDLKAFLSAQVFWGSFRPVSAFFLVVD